jgi:ATPase subunit of ABC transporter with duplicated ATPase domains
MLFVSHDRTLLKGLSTRVLELQPGEDDGAGGFTAPLPPVVYEGTYLEFVARTGSEAAGVHR